MSDWTAGAASGGSDGGRISGSTGADVSGSALASADKAPDYPPAQVLLTIPLDSDPYIEDDGGLPDWLVLSALEWIAGDIRAGLRSEWEMEPNCDTEEEE